MADFDQIEAVSFKPSHNVEQKRGVTPLQAALGIMLLIAAGIFWFLFTSKSVQLKFSEPTQRVSVEGGLSFELGGVWLLRQGQYTIQAEAELHEPLVREITVGTDRNQLHELTFIPLPGRLIVNAIPGDAEITVAGQSLGDGQLAAGAHTLEISHPRYQQKQIQIEIEGKLREQTLDVELTPNWSNVTVASQPAGATVLIDDEPWPQTTPVVVEALAGEREIAIKLDGFKTYRQRIFAQANQPQTLPEAVLAQADATVNVSSTPSAAGVLVNGRFMGRTPIELDLSSAQAQTIKLVNNGYADFSRTLRLQRGQVESLHANMRRQVGRLTINVEPASAQVYVNDRLIGTGAQSLNLPISPQAVSLQLDGYAGYEKTITPKVGLVQEIRVKLLTLEEARLAALKPSIQAPDGNDMLLFQPDDFTMGASRREPGRRANETLRPVKMERLFYLATHEVTNAQFRRFASGHDSGTYVETTLNEDDQPVANISWHDAAAYCNWLSDQAGLPPYYVIEFGKVVRVNWGAKGFRLPTEAEWAWAASTVPGDDQLRFPWCAQLPPPDRHGNYADRAASTLVGRIIFGYNDNYAAAAPVGSYKANHRGLYDMGGNVAEWMNDFYEIPDNKESQDPYGPPQGEYHVISGSSWMHGSITELRFAFRDYGIDARQDIGFRIARYAE